jgi:hypothetical protein
MCGGDLIFFGLVALYVTRTCYYDDEVKETGLAVTYKTHDRCDKYTKRLLIEH